MVALQDSRRVFWFSFDHWLRIPWFFSRGRTRLAFSFFLTQFFFHFPLGCDLRYFYLLFRARVFFFCFFLVPWILVDIRFSVSSTEKDIDTRLTKAWTAIDRLSIIWKSDLTDKMKRSFFQAAVVSILLYGCTTWTLTKRLERRLDGNYTRMLRAVLNKSWRQHPTRLQL